MNDVTIGMKLKIARIRKGVLQREVSLRTGMSATIISQIENSWICPTSDQVARLCAAIGIRPEDLQDGGHEAA